MKSITDIADRLKRKPSDVVGIHLDTGATRVVRLRKAKDTVSVTGIDSLPPAELVQKGLEGAADGHVRPLVLPSRLRAPHACFALPSDTASVKLLSFSGPFDEKAQERIPASMGLSEAQDYRIATRVIIEGQGRAESRVLAVAMPGAHIQAVTQLLPHGTPAPYTAEVAPLAAITAFARFLGLSDAGEAVGVIEIGTTASAFALFKSGTPLLFRLFEFGTGTIVDTVKEMLKVDRETAEGIISDGAFDISQPVRKAMAPLIKQLIVSRDFVERRENCAVSSLYVGGHMGIWGALLDDLHAALDLEVVPWNPLEGLDIHEDAIPGHLADQIHEFAAAVGACLPVMEDSDESAS
jgi:Tfp pilus assembly PilM family ATPase